MSDLEKAAKTATITVDKGFIGMAVTTLLRDEGSLGEHETIQINEWMVEDDTGYLLLSTETVEELLN